MDKIMTYRKLVQQILTNYADWANGSKSPSAELLCVFDEGHDLYLLLNAQWGQYRCIRGSQIFIRLHDGKIWIEEDWSEEGIATELLNNGVSKEDIVLGFQPPEMRKYSEFAPA